MNTKVSQPLHSSDRLLDVTETAAALGVGERMVRRLIAERRIPFHKIGKHVRVRQSDVEAFVAAGAVKPIRPAQAGA